MKLKSFFEVLGFRGKPKRYGSDIKTFDFDWLAQPIRYAQWLHPKETVKSISATEVSDYQKFLTKGDFCIDIGAHSGDSTLPMAVAVGVEGLVLALEPNPYVFPLLEKTVRLNRGVLNIFPLMAAAAYTPGYMTFEYSDSGFCNGGRHEGISKFRHGHAFKQEVVTVNLAQELKQCFSAELPRLKFIKVDTEGFDLQVLKSLAEVIIEYRPFIKAEVYTKLTQDQREQLLNFLFDHNYDIYKVTEQNIQGPKLTITDTMNWRTYDIFCKPN
jgi:FkbM family methyltransferase